MDNTPNDAASQSPQPDVAQQGMSPTAQIPVQQPSSEPAQKITLEALYGPSTGATVPQSAQTLPQDIQTSPIPDLPTINSPQPVREPLQEFPTVVEPQATVYDLPLRKQSFVAPEETTEKEIPVQNQEKKGVNKLVLFRIFFGGIGAILFVIILMFVVTFLSSFFHPTAAGKVALTYWGLWEDSTTMQVAISEFERQHPDITVQYEKEDPKQYSQRLLTRIHQGNGPDIFTYHSSWLPMVRPVLVPLPAHVITKEDLQANFYPVVRTDLVKNGALYGVPLEVDTLALFVNNALFQSTKAEVPSSWDAFGITARALTQKSANGKIKIAGAALGTFDNITHAPDILSTLFAQNGVDMKTISPKNNAADALAFYTSFATGDSNVWDGTLDPSQLAFAKGNLAMYFGYSWDIFAVKAINPSLDFSIYPIPHLPGRNTTAASYWVQGVSVKSVHQKEALLFMQFLAQKNTASLLYAEEAKTRLFGEPYARSDLGATLKSNQLVYPFVSQATDALSSGFAGETFDSGLNGQLNGYLGNAVRSVLNNTSPDSAIDTLLQGVQQIESQYGSG